MRQKRKNRHNNQAAEFPTIPEYAHRPDLRNTATDMVEVPDYQLETDNLVAKRQTEIKKIKHINRLCLIAPIAASLGVYFYFSFKGYPNNEIRTVIFLNSLVAMMSWLIHMICSMKADKIEEQEK